MDYHGITSSFICQPLLDFYKQNSAYNFAVRHKRKWLTNALPCIIIIRHLRECWNGRQARLRCVWLRRVGSSPISRTKIPVTPYGVTGIFCAEMDSKERPDRREGKKVSGGHFLSSWESPSDLRRIRYGCGSNSNVLIRKSVGMTHFSEKSFKNTRTKNPRANGSGIFPL